MALFVSYVVPDHASFEAALPPFIPANDFDFQEVESPQ